MQSTATKVNLQEALSIARASALEARKVLFHYWGRLEKVQVKEQAGLVSEADVESEKVITEALLRWNSNVAILGEESAYAQSQTGANPPGLSSRQARWIIDPLDGTTNYIHRFPIFCISIGLELNGELALGLVDVPVLDQTFTAIKGHGAFCNEARISVSTRSRLSDSLLATGFYHADPEVAASQVKCFSRLLGRSRGVRRAGSAAFDLCMVASGVFEAYWESHLQPWDTAGGCVIVREAGGRVTDYQGRDFHPEHLTVLATNGLVHDQVQPHLD